MTDSASDRVNRTFASTPPLVWPPPHWCAQRETRFAFRVTFTVMAGRVPAIGRGSLPLLMAGARLALGRAFGPTRGPAMTVRLGSIRAGGPTAGVNPQSIRWWSEPSSLPSFWQRSLPRFSAVSTRDRCRLRSPRCRPGCSSSHIGPFALAPGASHALIMFAAVGTVMVSALVRCRRPVAPPNKMSFARSRDRAHAR